MLFSEREPPHETKSDEWKPLAAKQRSSEEEARSVVEAWRASRQRVQTFAREHGLGRRDSRRLGGQRRRRASRARARR